MTNTTMLNYLQDGYNSIAYTDQYILGFKFKGVVYMTFADRCKTDRFTCLDRASRGAGYSLRFKPTVDQKIALLTNASPLCSVDLFDDMVNNSPYNNGDIFEKLVTEKLTGIKWEKDHIPFTEAGDVEYHGTAYQIKFEKATFTNEKTLMSLTKKA